MTNKIYKLHIKISDDDSLISEKDYYFFDKNKMWARKKQILESVKLLAISLDDVRINDSEITVEE